MADGNAKPPVSSEAKVTIPKESAPVLKTLRNRLNHPVTLSYNGDTIIVPPRGTCEKINTAMLGAVPSGVAIV